MTQQRKESCKQGRKEHITKLIKEERNNGITEARKKGNMNT